MRTINVHVQFLEEILGTASSDPDIHRRFIASKAQDAPKIEEEVAAIGADAVEERGTTVFPRTPDGRPMYFDYQIKGFFKDACGMLRRVSGYRSKDLRAYKKEIDGLIFPAPRMIPLNVPDATWTTGAGATVTVTPVYGCDEVNVTLVATDRGHGPVEARLLADGHDTGMVATLDAGNGWSHTFHGLRRWWVGECQRPLRAQTAQGERVALAHSEALPAGTTLDMQVACLVDDDVKYVLEWLQYGAMRGIGQWRNSGKGRFACRVTEGSKVLLDNIPAE